VTSPDRYGPDVLSTDWRRPPKGRSVEVAAERGLVVEEVQSGFCGAVVDCDKHGVTLEDRRGGRRVFALGPRFHLDGNPVVLTRPRRPARTTPGRTTSGSVAVAGLRTRIARESRIYVEGRHDAELVEKVWGDDLRVEGVVVEAMGGIDDLPALVAAFRPGPGRRLGILADHLVAGSKETRIAAEMARGPGGEHVLVTGHPYVDVWQAVRPSVLGFERWPDVPPGRPWKAGVLEALGWGTEPGAAWRRILGGVHSYADLEPALLGRVEELIDFVTTGPSRP
jgi:hypothetical protein